jgi:hypothetical protein
MKQVNNGDGKDVRLKINLRNRRSGKIYTIKYLAKEGGNFRIQERMNEPDDIVFEGVYRIDKNGVYPGMTMIEVEGIASIEEIL